MAGDGATVISSAAVPVAGLEPAPGGAEAAEVQPGDEFFDISGGLERESGAEAPAAATPEQAVEAVESEEETLLPGSDSGMDVEPESDDETLMPAGEMDSDESYSSEEETLLPSDYGNVVEEELAEEPVDNEPDVQAGDDEDETLLPGDSDELFEQEAPADDHDKDENENSAVDIDLFGGDEDNK